MTRTTLLGTVVAALVATTMATAQGHEHGLPTAPPSPAAKPAPLDERTRVAILEGLADERKTEAAYKAVIATLGEIRPFTNTVRAEHRHARFLENVLTSRGIAAPEPEIAAPASVPATAREACEAALASERQNVALYDRLLAAGPLPDDVKSAFEHNRWASLEHHVPAFERCVARSGTAAARRGGPGPGPGHTAGRGGGGRGRGRGAGPGGSYGCCGYGCTRGPAPNVAAAGSGAGG